MLEKIGSELNIHGLVLEDILNLEQRPKIEDYDSFIFVVLKMLSFNDKKQEIEIEQVSFILGSNYLFTFQEKEGDVFNGVRDRIRKSKWRVRNLGADYLLYALIDAVVDNYFVVLEKIGENIEDLEEEVVENPNPDTLQKIYSLKRELVFLRKSMWPLRELVSRLERETSDIIKDENNMYFRDVYDHAVQVVETIETFRDIVTGLLILTWFTETYTETQTFTETPTGTWFIQTFTEIPSGTGTHTLTLTPTYTSTSAVSPTSSPTGTWFTDTPTETFTPSYTYTETYTFTESATSTYTVTATETPTGTWYTQTFTETPTGTWFNYTPTDTFTATYTQTFTANPSDTFTFSATPTGTWFTDTPTETFTATNTDIPTNTGTPTPSPTGIWNTDTPTCTHTFTVTPTGTWFTDTPTMTASWAATPDPMFTSTHTPQAEGKAWELTSTTIFPNPFPYSAGSNVYIAFTASQSFHRVEFCVYTREFRKIMRVRLNTQGNGPGSYTVNIPQRNFRSIAAGIYYYYLVGINLNGDRIRSKPKNFVMLK